MTWTDIERKTGKKCDGQGQNIQIGLNGLGGLEHHT
ncbi:hypothetical protein SAMN04490203_2797 [Pseudomonas taetrolens]|uniref:Uncharacterized protein n=1 Tax=Pseudomonas taetrolens TaxID=47884 RepID=A0A1H4U470_PSETA|nr:hypothetical protein SAMN04490203_2797 [Pseudomonas taetrolens]SQF86941.1 Uncharacterised protein [Pseudomonas taetrolens]VEH50018.1 Uncharacterised protein [Pseudomonas taetrolens]